MKGVRLVRPAEPVTRRMPRPGPLVFGRGAEITLTLDETAFAGSYAFLLGRVLERFFARHAGLNTFTETVVNSLQRGELARWKEVIRAGNIRAD